MKTLLILIAMISASACGMTRTSPPQDSLEGSWRGYQRWDIENNQWRSMELDCWTITFAPPVYVSDNCGKKITATLSAVDKRTYVVIDEVKAKHVILRAVYEIAGDELTVNQLRVEKGDPIYFPTDLIPDGPKQSAFRFKRVN